MGIKSNVKYSFIVIGIIILFVGLINSILLFQIQENTKTKKDIDTLVYVQENMHELLKDLTNVSEVKKLEAFEDRFLKFELQFEELEEEYKNSAEDDFFDIFLTDIHDDKEIEKHLNILFSNEIVVEKAFDKVYDLQKEYILLDEKFKEIYPKESETRKELGRVISKLKDYELTKLYADVKYYSKETLYQYRDKKSLDIWVTKIEDLGLKYKSKLLDEYIKIAKDIGIYTIRLKEIVDEKNSLNHSIYKVINENKKHSLFILERIETSSSDFINMVYSSIVILITFIVGFISIFGYKVYRNVGLSVDEIEEKVQDGLREIKDLNLEIESTQKEVVFTMGAIGESRSKETGNHVKRVALYSKLFALHYGLSPEEADLLKQASPMHDIGKVAIPDAILNKPGRFDDEERKIMDTHAALGYEMLKHSSRPILKAASIVAHQHHEKWDGTGYPNGLSGEEIHIYGRITALADVFDALGSDRCYKKAWDDEKIFNLFKEEKGKHFDPKLVDIFFEKLDEFLKIREELKDQF